MEEHRIGMMYVNLVKSRLRRMTDAMFGRGVRRSSLLPWIVLLVVVAPPVGWYLHLHAKFHDLKREVKGDAHNEAAMIPRPGGADVLNLRRAETPGNNMPEFLSATILPGLGMDVLQITAKLPGQGEVALLTGPTVQQLADGTEDRSAPLDLHGALQAPWAGTLDGVLSPLANSLTTSWHGRSLEIATNSVSGRAAAEGGLMLHESAEASQSAKPDGASAYGVVRDTNFTARWPSKTEVSTSVQLSARILDLVITARNTGTDPEPMGLGWGPRFAVIGGRRDAIDLKLPGGEVLEIGDRVRALPTGKMIAADGQVSRFQGHAGTLGDSALEVALVHLRPGMMDSGPGVEIRNNQAHFGLRMLAMSSTTREFKVVSPAGAGYVQVGLQTNLDDPTGREWGGEEGGGIATLQPGQTLEWKMRLEIFPLVNHGASAQ